MKKNNGKREYDRGINERKIKRPEIRVFQEIGIKRKEERISLGGDSPWRQGKSMSPAENWKKKPTKGRGVPSGGDTSDITPAQGINDPKKSV